MRGPRPLRSLRQAIEDRDTHASRTDHLEDEPTKELIEQYLPQIANETRQAIRTNRSTFLYFRKKRMGRRCSCFLQETTPDASCQICFGSGFVGGWDLHGCRTDLIDITNPDLRMVSVEGNFDAGQRPVCMVLENGANRGFVETELPLVRNIRKAQKIQTYIGALRSGTKVETFIRASGDVGFVPLTDASFEARSGESRLLVRAVLSRSNSAMPSPKLSHILFRYHLIPDIRMYGDGTLAEESFEMGDLGFTDAYSTVQLLIPRDFDRLQTEDFLIRQSDQKRFKITRSERNAPLEVLLSHRIMGRLLVPGNDSLVFFPGF